MSARKNGIGTPSTRKGTMTEARMKKDLYAKVAELADAGEVEEARLVALKAIHTFAKDQSYVEEISRVAIADETSTDR